MTAFWDVAIALMRETVSDPETSANFYHTTRPIVSGDSHLHTRRRENPKSQLKTDHTFVSFLAEKDPYPVDALPTCNHALSVCQQERKCIKLFEDFKINCKVRDGKCRMDDR
jgi:hypothetical protein